MRVAANHDDAATAALSQSSRGASWSGMHPDRRG